jgi:hypothetical protein
LEYHLHFLSTLEKYPTAKRNYSDREECRELRVEGPYMYMLIRIPKPCISVPHDDPTNLLT